MLYGESEAQGLVEVLKEAFADCAVGGSEIQEAGTAASGDFDALTVGKLGALPISRSDEATFVDLPGIGWALAGKLESAGIGSSVELEQMGAVEAWRRIRLSDGSFPPKWAYSFEAAIRDISVNSIDPKRKRRLKSDAKALVAKDTRMA